MQVSFIVHCVVPNRFLPCGYHPPLWDPVFRPDPRLGNTNCQLDGFDMTGGWCLLCIYDAGGNYILFFFANKKIDVESVESVAQSKNSTENS